MSMMDDKLRELDLKPEGGKPAKVEAIEERVGATLPEGYRRFLTMYGGGMFGEDVYYSDQKQDGPVLFGWFFDPEEVLDAIESFSEVIPESMIPIGEDGGGNLYCLGVKGGDENGVYFHDHGVGWRADAEEHVERGEEVPPDIRYQTVYRISDTFEDFVASMSKG